MIKIVLIILGILAAADTGILWCCAAVNKGVEQ